MIYRLPRSYGEISTISRWAFPNMRRDVLAGYWALKPTGSTLRDTLSGAHRDGTLEAMELDTDWIISGNPRLPGYALNFGGGPEFVNIGTQLSDSLAGLTAFTVLVSLNYDSSGTEEHTFLSNWSVAATTANILLRLEPTDDSVECFVITEADTQVGGNFTDVTVIPNSWNRIGIRFNSLSGEGLSVMVNGVKSATTYASSAALDSEPSLSDLYIASTPHTTDSLTGKIDYLIVYGRPLLDSEMLLDYNNPAAAWRLRPRRAFKAPDIVNQFARPDGDVSVGGWRAVYT